MEYYKGRHYFGGTTMKKVITILLVCVLCVGLFCACGKKDDVDKKPVESIIPDEIVITETTLMDPDDGKIKESPDHSPDASVKPEETKKPSEKPTETIKPDDTKKD